MTSWVCLLPCLGLIPLRALLSFFIRFFLFTLRNGFFSKIVNQKCRKSSCFISTNAGSAMVRRSRSRSRCSSMMRWKNVFISCQTSRWGEFIAKFLIVLIFPQNFSSKLQLFCRIKLAVDVEPDWASFSSSSRNWSTNRWSSTGYWVKSRTSARMNSFPS